MASTNKEETLRIIQAKLKKVGILVSKIPDISRRKSEHFQIVAVNISILDIEGYNTVNS